GHSISFFEDGSAPALLGKLIELKGKHDLVRQRLGQFNLLWPIGCQVAVADSNKTPNLSTHQNRNSQKSFCPLSLQIVAPHARNSRISLQVFANHRTSREKKFLDYGVLFQNQRVFHEWVLRIRRDQSSAIHH